MTAIINEVIIGTIRLILGDARDVLLEIPKSDLAVFDPPYKLTSGGNAVEVMGGIFGKDEYDNSGDLMEMVRWSEIGGPIYRALNRNADCYVMVNDKNIFGAHGGFTGAGFKFHNMLVWDKVRATRNRWYMKNLEFTLYFWKGNAAMINFPGSKQLFTDNADRVTEHPTEKPVSLMRHYIENSSNVGQVVLDPFMGSGSTMVAAVEAGRGGVGIEIDPDCFEVACDRVKKAHERISAVPAVAS